MRQIKGGVHILCSNSASGTAKYVIKNGEIIAKMEIKSMDTRNEEVTRFKAFVEKNYHNILQSYLASKNPVIIMF